MNFWIKFLLPGYYYFYSRLPRKSEQVSWLIVFPLLVLLGILFVSDRNPFTVIAIYIIANICWLNFYEIGYLENDAITIKREKSPTLRIPDQEIMFIQANFKKLSFLRMLIGIFLLIIIYSLIEYTLSFYLFVLAILLARVFFYLHNNIRNRLNIITYHFLSTTKFFVFPLLLVPNKEQLAPLLIALYFSFPLPRTIEHAVKTKYNLGALKAMVGELDTFRLKYYLFLVVIALAINLFKQNQYSEVFLFISLYYFIYRLTGFYLIKLGAYRRSKFKSHDWNEKS